MMKRIPAFLSFLFYANFAFGEHITTNVINGCGDAENVFYALFEPNVYNCLPGYYLPANTDGCRECLSGYTCEGGAFMFNEVHNQGLVYTMPIVENVTYGCNALAGHGILTAEFAPNSHTCSAGYYLPANVDECTLCPAGTACLGGTFTFNETTDQGIQSCATGTFAPTASPVCYPHRLHIGDDVVYVRSTKLTTPSLNIDIDRDGVADFFVNMTTTRTRMNKDSEHYFHAQWGNNDYYICDDTTCPQ